jgi:prophage regulatory protein
MTTERILAKKEVMHLTGLSKSTIYLYIQHGIFPASIKIGLRRVGWVESEINDWLKNTIKQGRFYNAKKNIITK